ncbi:MAG: methyltransferase domain-containing protein [Bacteroidota bacterium]
MNKRIGDYEQFARAYAEKVEVNAYNALYERPALISKLPSLEGMRVLDAGCGVGGLSELMISRGAHVVAVDRSPEMLEIAKERLGSKGTLMQMDLSAPLTALKTENFNLVVSSLTLHYIEDWSVILQEINRVLLPNGELIFSTHHPFLDHSHLIDMKYFERQIVEEPWEGFTEKPVIMRYYRRSLGEMYREIISAGFSILDMVEPFPLPSCKERFPKEYEILSKRPVFIIFHLKKTN